MLACRACRVPMTATVGCGVCDPMRRNLVVVGEDEEERPSLSGTASEMVAMLRGRMKVLKREESATLDKAELESIERRMMFCANTLAKLLESARKLTQDGLALVENLSFQERKELFVTWYTELAPAYRNAVREAFAAYEAEVSKPLKPAEEPVLS